MPQIPQKEVRRMVGACPCPDAHKAQLEETLLSLPNFNLGKIAQILQTLGQYAVKYGPQIWADIQVLISLFGLKTDPTVPVHPDGPEPAQMLGTCKNERGLLRTRSGFVTRLALLVICLVALFAIFATTQVRGAERPPQNCLTLPQNCLATDCPCGPNCDCGPDCKCGQLPAGGCGSTVGEKLPCGVSRRLAEYDPYADAVVYNVGNTEEQDVEPLSQQPKRAPQNELPPPKAAVAATGPTFHTEVRYKCNGRFGPCVPYTVTVMDSPGVQAAGPDSSAWSGVPIQCWSVPVTTYKTVRQAKTVYEDVQVPVTTYQTVQAPMAATTTTTQTFASYGGDGGCASCGVGDGDAGGSCASASGRKGLFQRFRERRASRHASRVGGCFSCGG